MLFFSIILIWTIESGFGQICTQEGFFRNPTNCKKFYRCVDLWQNGRELTIYHFNCPVGTVFDETVSICNWPQLAAPCDEMTTAPIQIATTETSQQGMSGGDPEVGGNGETVILKPSFSFQCRGEGLFEHANDCSKFWVCEPVDGDEDTKQSVIESKLFVCPDNYWFDNERLRCLKKEMVTCDKKPNFTKTANEPQAIKLNLADLDSFFSRYTGIAIISV